MAKKKTTTKKTPRALMVAPPPPTLPTLDAAIGDEGLTSTIRKMLFDAYRSGNTTLTTILAKQINRAKLGDTKAAAFLIDRAYGLPTQSVRIQQMPEIVVRHNNITVDEAKASGGKNGAG